MKRKKENIFNEDRKTNTKQNKTDTFYTIEICSWQSLTQERINNISQIHTNTYSF